MESIIVSTNAGIQNYSEMDQKERAYVIKLSLTIIAAIFTGFLTGSIYNFSGGITLIGFGIYFAVTLGASFLIKVQFDLDEMTDVQIIRHGIAIGFLTYVFIWVVILNFIVF